VRGGDQQALPAQRRTDRLDPMTIGPHLVDGTGRSTAVRVEFPREEIDAAFRISLASFKSRTSACGRLISASGHHWTGRCAAPLVDLGPAPPSAATAPGPPPEHGPQRLRRRPHLRIVRQSIKNHPGRTLPLLRLVPRRHDVHHP
jgi:hypothetical protein